MDLLYLLKFPDILINDLSDLINKNLSLLMNQRSSQVFYCPK
jgi:hypothetical protein